MIVKSLSLILLAGILALTAQANQPVVEKILFVGNSITKHGPADQLGWTGNWGMAASSEEKDYVHLFATRIAQSQGGKMPELMIGGGGGGRLDQKMTVLENFTKFGADLAVVQLGENDKEKTGSAFQQPYEKIIQAIKEGNPKARILCLGVWTSPDGNAVKDAMIREACQKFGATFVDMTAENADPVNQAGSEKRFTHAGVNWHPGDKGMLAYANALWLGWTNPELASKVAHRAGRPEEVLITENWDGQSDIKWSPSLDSEDGKLRITSDGSASAGVETRLPTERCVGRVVTIETEVSAEHISEKPAPHNGIKVMLVLENAEGETNYPQTTLPVGTFDKKPVKFIFHIPDNIVSVKLRLGLERVSGTAWFHPLRISAAQ